MLPPLQGGAGGAGLELGERGGVSGGQEDQPRKHKAAEATRKPTRENVLAQEGVLRDAWVLRWHTHETQRWAWQGELPWRAVAAVGPAGVRECTAEAMDRGCATKVGVGEVRC